MDKQFDMAPDGDNESNHSDEEGEDPCRIQVELDILNSASDNINKLESELEKARNRFLKTKSEAGTTLNEMLKKIGRRSVKASQSYYTLLKDLQKVQVEAQRAALKYQDAYGAYAQAKDAVREAELQVALEGKSATPLLDSMCQEILNRATIALFNAEKQKITCEQEHHLKTSQCSEFQHQMAKLLKEKPQAIQKAKPFYELRDTLEMKLKTEKQNAEDLQLALACNKQKYKLAMNNLEHMSEGVHTRRKSRQSLPPRTPGVGAEAESEYSDLPSSSIDMLSENTSQCSLEFYDDKSRKELEALDNMHELYLNIEKEGFDVLGVPSRPTEGDLRGLEAGSGEKLRREDLLVGAENVQETPRSEYVDLALPQPVETEQEKMTTDLSKSMSQSQKRTMVVRDLPKGIYVASSVNTGAPNTSKTDLLHSTMNEGQLKEESQSKKKILQQFPLLQGLLGSKLGASTQGIRKF